MTLLAAAAVALLPRIALAYFAFPSADDYCIVVETHDDGFWFMQVNSYLTWTGRYAAVFLEGIIAQFDLIGVYRWFSMATLLANILAMRALIGAVCGRAASGRDVTVTGAVAAAVFVGGLPSIVEAFYWMPGEASYQWGTITYLVWVSLLIRIASGEVSDRRTVIRAATLMLTLVLPGFNEVMAPILLATIGAFIVANRRRPFESDRFMLALLGIIVVLTAVSFLAPGNSNRSSVYPDIASRHNLQYALIETGRQTARFLVHYGGYPALWLAAFAGWWWGESMLPRELTPPKGLAFNLAVLVGLAAVAYLTLFPVYWEYGEVNYSGEGRTYNVTYVVVCAIVVWVAGLVVRTVRDRFETLTPARPVKRGRLALLVAGALAVVLIASPSTLTVFGALRIAPQYLRAERARAAILQTSPHTGTVFVDALLIKPAGLFWSDIQPDSGHWINTCVAKYFGLNAVRTRM